MKELFKIIGIWIIIFILGCSGLATPVHLINLDPSDGGSMIVSDTNHFDYYNDSAVQGGQLIKTLEWTAPPGHLPGSYAQYLLSHPQTSARFLIPDTYLKNVGMASPTLVLLINETLYPAIQGSLAQYIKDVEYLGHVVLVQLISGGTPEDIKAWIIDHYLSGCEGFVFVGDITAAWAEVSGSVFPCDLFYMDLDGTWMDADNDGVYETHLDNEEGDMGPEVYVARIHATTLTYDSEANMVNEYFTKAHQYRTGELTQPWHGLEYVDEDWYSMNVHLDYIYGEHVTRYDYGYFTTADDYLTQLAQGHHFVQVCAHSFSGGHHFSTRPTESASYAHVYVYSPSTRSAKLLLGSDDGVKVWLNQEHIFTADRYGGWKQDRYEVDVTLIEGWNQLLCKVSQEGGQYKLSTQFTDLSYNSFSDLHYQINNPTTHDHEAPFIRSWIVHGFHQDNSENFWNYLTTNYINQNEATVTPEPGELMAGKNWTIYNSGGPYIDLSAYCDEANFGVCYAYVSINSTTNQTCQLWTGYDDGTRIWLNGEELLYDNRYGGYSPDMTKLNVTLKRGENHLLFKISEWMGEHGFSARFCNPDGSSVNGLTYQPAAQPISHIGTWLINGPYTNPNKATRLSTDYLGNEHNSTPSEGDAAPLNTWERGIGRSCPFDLDTYFDHGDWVFSQDIQDHDPPVLFYNLFSCGPGRFTDENYLAGAYIFHTSSGLITIASAKSGSMLNFQDFTNPLGNGESIGDAFATWFDKQAPYAQWEKEWYYGMVICGDPTLHIPPATQMKITRPSTAIYIADREVFPFRSPVIFGKITCQVEVSNLDHGIDYVEFYLDGIYQETVAEAPFVWCCDIPLFFSHDLTTIAYDTDGKNTTRSLSLWKFF